MNDLLRRNRLFGRPVRRKQNLGVRFGLLAVLATAAISLTSGQSVSDPVSQPPPGSRWRMTIVQRSVASDPVHSGTAAPAQGALPTPTPLSRRFLQVPESLDVKTDRNNVTLGIITHSDKTKRRFYVIDDLVFVEGGDQGRVLLYPARPEDPLWLESSRFPGTLWITPAHYVGEAALEDSTREKQAHLHYKQDGAVNFEAWIRAGDRRPVKVALGENHIYEFEAVSRFDDTIPIPSAVLAARDEMRKKRAAIEAVRKANLRQAR